MADNQAHDEKEVKRRKQLKKMTKILEKAWEIPKSEPFQESSRSSSKGNVFDLATLGEYLGEGSYKVGRSGWEKFAQDIGGVYNRHIEWYVLFVSTVLLRAIHTSHQLDLGRYRFHEGFIQRRKDQSVVLMNLWCRSFR
jgi:hypothetical protein